LHAAAILSVDGRVLAAFEDIGRHNAVDKCVGSLVLSGAIPARDQGPALLAVSGRASFEVIQKAAAAGLRAVASVSAPSSLAIDLAQAVGVALAGFVREGRLTVYSHPEVIG
jgi:FdhD protein